MAVTKLKRITGHGWDGWCGLVYQAPPNCNVDTLLQLKAMETGDSVAVIDENYCLYGWGYTSADSKDGPYFYPFFIESDRFHSAGGMHIETRSMMPLYGPLLKKHMWKYDRHEGEPHRDTRYVKGNEQWILEWETQKST